MSRCLLWLLLVLFPVLARADVAAPAEWMPRVEDATGLWWVEGPPRGFQSEVRPREETLCFQYGGRRMLLDTLRVRPLEGEWDCAVTVDGRRYGCTGRTKPRDEWEQPVRVVESGRFFQRVVIAGLTFADAEGRPWEGSAELEICVWPDRLAYRLMSAGEAVLELRNAGKVASGRGAVLLEVEAGEAGEARAAVESELTVTRDEALGCHRLALPEVPWSNASRTYYPEEHLDRVDRWRVTLRNDGDTPTVARLMFTQEKHLPITGFTPMLCEVDGAPTGLPVQLSKNWHTRAEKGRLPHDGSWFHGMAWVRVPPRSQRDLVFQMVHARYGGVCAASHAQLCLIGWGHNQFWDQVAVGSFGESICFEPGRVQRRCFITDVRPLLTLGRQPEAKRWGWAENAGGGDFLLWRDGQGAYQPMRGTRTEYRAHGPCLTDVVYREETRGGEIAARMEVSVPAANDHLRTLLRLRYDVRQPVRWQRLAFFQLGADFYNDVPARRLAIGDATGLREEWEPRRARDEYDRPATPLVGEAAWISVHGVERAALRKGHASASRGVIVRGWRAVLGGQPAAPHVATYATEWGRGNHRTAVELAPPPGVTLLQPGDYVEAELEFVVFPAEPEAYYGPDVALREVLSQAADTWRPVHREARAQLLRPAAERGQVTRSYPLVVAVDAAERALVKVRGGLGHLPVTFTGLTAPQSRRVLVNGTPVAQWQTDWNAEARRWQITCNVATGEERELTLALEPAQ